jgi:Tfp pilus assembly protein PilF
VISERYFGPYPQVLLGYVELARGDVGEARDHFRQAMRACPEYTASLTGLARIAWTEGRVHDALQIYMKVIAVDTRDVEAWIGGAEAQIALGFTDNARSWVARLEQVMPEHPALGALVARIAAGESRAHAGS